MGRSRPSQSALVVRRCENFRFNSTGRAKLRLWTCSPLPVAWVKTHATVERGGSASMFTAAGHTKIQL